MLLRVVVEEVDAYERLSEVIMSDDFLISPRTHVTWGDVVVGVCCRSIL